jgi:hypothetical protein
MWRTILDEHDEEILEHASDQLVMSRRLKTIKAEDLVCMLANGPAIARWISSMMMEPYILCTKNDELPEPASTQPEASHFVDYEERLKWQ